MSPAGPLQPLLMGMGFLPGIGVNPLGGLVRDALYFVLNQVQKLI